LRRQSSQSLARPWETLKGHKEESRDGRSRIQVAQGADGRASHILFVVSQPLYQGRDGTLRFKLTQSLSGGLAHGPVPILELLYQGRDSFSHF
jgi:hypothetical protein